MSKLSENLSGFVQKHPRVHACVAVAENVFKKPVFGCQDCGQCVLSYNAFVCCMRCPKQLRNGPCGGTRPDGHCEVYPERLCVWWKINKRAKMLGMTGKLRKYHIPVDRRFEHTSAWMNMFGGKILPLSLHRDLTEEEQAELTRAKEQPA